ncbi:TonB-dependent receptor [Flavisolibacter sp. BT320]|nr:TonB-dependent receptor [Flavisolibacter longurius]
MRNKLLLFFFIFLAANASGQTPSLVSGHFVNLPLKKFFQQVEAQTPYYFYYDSTQVDSLTVNILVQEETLPAVLQKVFRGTDLQFAIDAQNRVFITEKIPLQTQLPPNFFQPVKGQPKTDHTQSMVITSTAESRRQAASENKIYEVGIKTNNIKPGNVVVSGYVRHERSGEPVANASLFVDSLNRNVLTNTEGYYNITLPAGSHNLYVQSLGMQDAKLKVVVYSEGTLNLELKEHVALLKEVVVSAQKLANVNRVQLGMERLSIEAIKKVPAVFGEADILRAVLTLPGVKTVGEASTGLNVRGGSADQNLVLMNGATVYNPSHFFGMFAAFNPEIVKDVELYKSSIPAKYGGRLSSVLDIGLREGNKKEITGSAGIGIVTSRFNIEGPLAKEKTSFILGGRTTYSNWLMDLLPDEYRDAKASFYDVNLGISHRINPKNDLYFTGYISNDKFNLASDTTYGYSNRNFNLRWRHQFSTKMLANFSVGSDRYEYGVNSTRNKVNAYKLGFDINQLNLRGDFSYVASSSHTLEFGASSIRYKLHPGTYVPNGGESLITPNIVAPEQALESAIYLSDRYTISSNFSISGGIRFSLFQYLGGRDVSYYAPGVPRDESTVIETKSFGSGKVINTDKGPEYRVSARYAFSPSFSVKAGYNSQRQYIHMLSNTTAIAPTDVWKLSDPNIKPQRGDQVSIGLYKNLKSNTIETSAEVYYKKIRDYLDYKPGASLVLNHNIETDVINTRGKAYGAELMIRKTSGKLNGWVSYTYSRILLQVDDPTVSLPVNDGKWYPANYDKPHDVTAIGNFKVNHRFSLSLNLTYSTGRPITLPIGLFNYAGSQRVLYADRNSYRIPDYFRADFSMNIDGNHKVKQRTHNSWTIGVYNLTGQRNPFSVYYVSEAGQVRGYKLSIFGNAIPFVNFNIRF